MSLMTRAKPQEFRSRASSLIFGAKACEDRQIRLGDAGNRRGQKATLGSREDEASQDPNTTCQSELDDLKLRLCYSQGHPSPSFH